MVNMLIVAIEVAVIAAASFLAWRAPLWFAGLTFVLALGLGLRLDVERLAHESPFYFGRVGGFARPVQLIFGCGEAAFKAVLAAAIALITFSGTDAWRLQITAALFGGLVLFGSALLRRLTVSLAVRPARWGYFRMAAPFGLLFSLGMSFFPPPNLAGLAWRALFEVPQRPNLAQLAETLFQVRMWADDMVVRVLNPLLGADAARVAGLVISSNVLTGFLVALYAVAVSEIVRGMEERWWRREARGGT